MTFETASKALRTVDLGSLDALGQAGTVFATLDGAPVAVVPLDLYRQLVAAAVRPYPVPVKPKSKGPPSGLSSIERDAEVVQFLRESFRHGVATHEVRQACLDRFGAARTPSHSRVQRYRTALQRAR